MNSREKGIKVKDATYKEFLDAIKAREAEQPKNAPAEPENHDIEIKGLPAVTDDVLLDEELERLRKGIQQKRNTAQTTETV